MKEFLKKHGILLSSAIVFLLTFAISVILVFTMLTGGAAKGKVAHLTMDSKRANATIEYEVNGEEYTFKRAYGRNSGLRAGKEVTVYYAKKYPSDGFIIKDCTLIWFIAGVSGVLTIILIKPRRKRTAE